VTFLRLEPLGPALGAQVDGVDLSQPVSSEVAAALRAHLLAYHLLVFRNVSFTAREHVQFMESLDLGQAIDEKKNGEPWGWVTNSADSVETGAAVVDGTGSELLWHADYEFTRNGPIRAISLYSTEKSEATEPTLFANMIRAAKVLSQDLRERIRDLRVLKAKELPDGSFTNGGTEKLYMRNRVSCPSTSESTFLATEHAVLERHSVTGEEWLSPSHMMTSHIVGWSDDKSDELFAELDRVAYAPDNIYSHTWRNRDLLVWDNIGLHHARGVTPVGTTGVRVLRRVAVDPVDLSTQLAELTPLVPS
jgi:taurine dioxygenase